MRGSLRFPIRTVLYHSKLRGVYNNLKKYLIYFVRRGAHGRALRRYF